MKTIKIFISSTFKDMNAERDVLIRSIFPRLREKAEALGVRIQEIDLRWGVTEEDVKKGEVLDLCLDSIEECKPYFICLLGRRYGWIPAPVYIMKDEFQSIVSDRSSLDEEEKDLLKHVYHMDDNGRVYRLDVTTPNRQKDDIQKMLEKAGMKDSSISITAHEINYVMFTDMLPHSIPDMDKLLSKAADEKKISREDSDFMYRFYTRLGSEHVWRRQPGICKDEEPRISDILKASGYRRDYHRFFFLREDEKENFYNVDEKGTQDSNYVEAENSLKARLESLKSEILQSGNYVEYKKYPCRWDMGNADREGHGVYPVTGLEEFEELVFTSLWNHIKDNAELKGEDTEEKPLIVKEHEEQLKFIDSRTYNFCGREGLLEELEYAVDKALTGELKAGGRKTRTIMVVGEPGSGKSALLARFYSLYSMKHGDYIVIPRFIGGRSSRSTNPRNLLGDFCTLLINEYKTKQGTDKQGDDGYGIPWERVELVKTFIDWLQKVDKNVVIVLDAINQMQKEFVDQMMWLPDELPDNVCIVTSIVDDGRGCTNNMEDMLECMRKRSIPPYEIRVASLTGDEKKQIIHSYLRQFNKRLQDGLAAIIAGKDESHRPLYLQTALEELRLVSRHEEVEGYIRYKMPGTSVEMFKQILERLHKELERRLGNNFFEGFMVYMASGRNGMSEEDLRLLMGRWQNANETGKQEASISEYHWGELKRAMRPYLLQRGDEWDFFHAQLRQAVEERYLGSEEKVREAHNNISQYLELMGFKHAMTVKDLPYHLHRAMGRDKGDAAGLRLRKLLLGYGFIHAKVNMGMTNELIDDYSFAAGDRLLELLKSAMMLGAHILLKYPGQLPSQLTARLAGCREQEILDLLEDIKLVTAAPWIRPKRYSFESTDSSLIRTLTGHSQSVDGVCAAPDGRRVVSASWDNTLKVWDMESGREINTLKGHSDVVTSVSITPDGKRAVSSSWDGTVRVWDVEGYREIHTLRGHFKRVDSVIAIGGEKAVSISGSTIKVWDIDNGRELQSYYGNENLYVKVVLTCDGRYALSEVSDGVVKIWDTVSRKKVFTLKAESLDTHELCIMPGGRFAISACNDDYSLKVWDLKRGKMIYKLPGHTGFINDLKITPDGRRAVSASSDHTIKVWDLDNKKELYTLRGHSSDVKEVFITPDGRKIVSASNDHTLKVWSLEKSADNNICTQHYGAVSSIDVTPDGRIAVSASEDTTLKLWDIAGCSEIGTLKGHEKLIWGVRITPDGRYAVSTAPDSSFGSNVKVWDLKTFREKYTVKVHNNLSNAIISPDGRYGVDTTGLYYILVWDLESGNEVCRLEHSDYIYDACFTPDGRTIISGCADKTVNIWDLKSMRKIRTIGAHDDRVSQVKITPDGRKIVSASWDNTLKIWDLGKGRLIRTMKGHNSSIARVYMSPDGRTVVSLDYGHVIKVWDMERGEDLYTFNLGSSDIPIDVCISPDGSIAAYTHYNSITVWSMEDGDTICRLIGDSDFSRVRMTGGREMVAGDRTGTMHFLTLENINMYIPAGCSNK